MFFELVSILLPLFQIMVIKYMTKENENWTSLKNFAPKLNLNHNIYNILIANEVLFATNFCIKFVFVVSC